jgi:hypothetical protein
MPPFDLTQTQIFFSSEINLIARADQFADMTPIHADEVDRARSADLRHLSKRRAQEALEFA